MNAIEVVEENKDKPALAHVYRQDLYCKTVLKELSFSDLQDLIKRQHLGSPPQLLSATFNN